MTWEELNSKYCELQNEYGEPSLDSIVSGGKFNTPDICLVFMNPTGRNIASEKTWKSIKSPWIGTKNIWKLITQIDLLDKDLYKQIQKKKPLDWDYTFSENIYKDLESRGVYITNLAKCTQLDARPLSNRIFKEYKELLLEEFSLVKPKKIVTFGNQVSSIFIGKPISVSKDRRNIFQVNNIPVLPTYYPVGQGQRNIDLAIEDVKWFLNNE